MVLEKTPESPLDSKDIKPGNPKGNQPSILIGRTDAKAKTPVLLESSSSSQGFNLKGGMVSVSNDAASQFPWTVHLFQV